MRGVLVLLGALALVAVPEGAGVAGPTYESFEQGLGAWSVDHHVWCYDAPQPCDWSWSADLSPGVAYDGAWGLLIGQDGIHDSGTVWVEREIPVPPGDRVELAFWIFSPYLAPTASWHVRAYIGDTDPESEGDFVAVGELDNIIGWQRYCLSAPAPAGPTMWVAGGPRVSWEGPRVHVLDYVSVRGATGGEACGLFEDPCHLLGTPCGVARAACAVAPCVQGRPL